MCATDVEMEVSTRLPSTRDSEQVPNHPVQISKETSVNWTHDAQTPRLDERYKKGSGQGEGFVGVFL